MDFKIPCSTWIGEEDEKVLAVLRQSDRWLSAGELSQMTGLSEKQVARTLALLKKQLSMQAGRDEFFK